MAAGGEYGIEARQLLVGEAAQVGWLLEPRDGVELRLARCREVLARSALGVCGVLDLRDGEPTGQVAVVAQYVGDRAVLAPGQLGGAADCGVRLGSGQSP